MPGFEFQFPPDIQTALYDDDANAVLTQISRRVLPDGSDRILWLVVFPAMAKYGN